MTVTGAGTGTAGGTMVGDTTTMATIMAGVVTQGNGWTIIILYRRQTTITSNRLPTINQGHNITRHDLITTMAADAIVKIASAKVCKTLCLGTFRQVGYLLSTTEQQIVRSWGLGWGRN